jgi:hypothetical protein
MADLMPKHVRFKVLIAPPAFKLRGRPPKCTRHLESEVNTILKKKSASFVELRERCVAGSIDKSTLRTAGYVA